MGVREGSHISSFPDKRWWGSQMDRGDLSELNCTKVGRGALKDFRQDEGEITLNRLRPSPDRNWIDTVVYSSLKGYRITHPS